VRLRDRRLQELLAIARITIGVAFCLPCRSPTPAPGSLLVGPLTVSAAAVAPLRRAGGGRQSRVSLL
jgi:hypothetical protein